MKMRDEFAEVDKEILEAEPDSALTGRSLEEVAEESFPA